MTLRLAALWHTARVAWDCWRVSRRHGLRYTDVLELHCRFAEVLRGERRAVVINAMRNEGRAQ